MKKVEIIRKDICAPWLKVIGALIFMATFWKVVTLTFFDVNPIMYLVANLIAVAIWTAKEIVVVDFEKQEIGEGFRMIGYTNLDKTKFSGLEKIYINSVNMAQTFRHLATSTDIRHVDYKAFLKTIEGDKYCIGVHKSKDELIARLKKYNQTLQTIMFDTTSSEAVVIE